MKRIAAVSLNAALMFGALACADRTASGPDESSPSTPAGIVVSNPKAGSTTGNSMGMRGSLSVSSGTVAYVSAAPGTFSDAESGSIRNETRSGASQSVQVIDGGFDPVAVEAEEGDEISLRIFMGVSQVRNLTLKVPPRRPPEVVRTSPPKGRTDVALNVQIVVVFSEPVDSSSVTSSVTLVHDGVGVNGHSVVSTDGLSAEFVLDSLLRGQTTYSLTIDPGLRDLDGDTLGDQSTTVFTTGTSELPVGQLLFTQISDRNIYRINADGTGLTRLTVGGADYHAQWSPNGRRIAYSHNVQDGSNRGFGTADIYVMDADGSNVIRRTVDSFFWSAAWSPDGRKLAISDEEVYYASTYLISADDDGSSITLLANDARSPAWSPDGSQIAYVHTSGDDGYHQIYLMKADGTGAHPVTEFDPGGIFGVAWSPDGRRLAFGKCLLGDCAIYVMEADGSGVHAITGLLEGTPALPTWSPDGAWIAFTLDTYPGGEWLPIIAYIPATGGSPHVLVTGGFGTSWH
jgi:TolB protein